MSEPQPNADDEPLTGITYAADLEDHHDDTLAGLNTLVDIDPTVWVNVEDTVDVWLGLEVVSPERIRRQVVARAYSDGEYTVVSDVNGYDVDVDEPIIETAERRLEGARELHDEAAALLK